MKKQYVIIAVVGIIGVGILSMISFGGGTGVLRQLGNVVGIYASIEPNEYNTLAQQLDQRAKELDKKESQLEEQRAQAQEVLAGRDHTAIVYITSIGVLLLTLVLLNFYLDWRRKK